MSSNNSIPSGSGGPASQSQLAQSGGGGQGQGQGQGPAGGAGAGGGMRPGGPGQGGPSNVPGGGGPAPVNPSATPAAKEALLKAYNKRLKDSVKSMVDNFSEIVKIARVESEGQVLRATQADEDQFEMSVRAANMVRAGESLIKLVADIKQSLILNDFPSVNEAIVSNSSMFKQKSLDCDRKLMALRDDMAGDLYDLEEEYYSSAYK